MIIHKYKIFFAVILIFICSNLYSQAVRFINETEAISLAISNNSELVNARYEKLKAEKKVNQVYMENLIPSFSLSTQYIRAFKKQVIDIFGQRFEIGTDNTIYNVFNLQQTIPFLGAPVFSGVNIAEFYSKLQDENIISTTSKVKTDVKKSFYNVLFLKEVLEVNKQALKNAEDNLRLVEAKYKNGVVLEFDYLRAKVTVESLKPNVSQSESNLLISKKLLKNNIGIKTNEEIDVTGNLKYDSLEVFGETEKIITKIADSSVSIRQLSISQKINRELVTIDKSNYLPKLFIFGQYSLNAAENDGRGLFDFRYYKIVNAGIGLVWDFNIFKTGYKTEQSEIDVKKTNELILDVKQKLKIQAKNILLRMEDAKKRIVSQYETVKLAEKGYDLANRGYKDGVLNQIDVLDAELRFNQTKLAYLQAIYDYLTAKAELEGLLEL
jgi:outer membrane protein TolC